MSMEIPYTVQPRADTGLTNGKLGIWLFLASEVMLFGALFATYILLRVGAPEWPRGREFLKNYGVDIVDGPLAGVSARAVVVLDENNKVLHAELVPEIKNEPNYDAALAALK